MRDQTPNETFIFYHSADMDGHFSGYVAHQKFPDAHLRPFNYGDEFPWDEIPPKSLVVMLDLCLQPYEEMLEFKNRDIDLIWIDHHYQAINQVHNLGLKPEGIQSTDHAACRLAFEYFYPGEQVPLAIDLASKFDSWQWKKEGLVDALVLNYYFSSIETDPATDEGHRNLTLAIDNPSNHIYSCIEEGFIIKRFIDQNHKDLAKALAFQTTLDGFPIVAANQRLVSSEFFSSVRDKFPECHIYCTFGWHRDHWSVSIYSDSSPTNLGKLAESYGGGGHYNAAGFSCQELPFPVMEKNNAI